MADADPSFRRPDGADDCAGFDSEAHELEQLREEVGHLRELVVALSKIVIKNVMASK